MGSQTFQTWDTLPGKPTQPIVGSSSLAAELGYVVYDENAFVTGISNGFALASSVFSGHGSTIGQRQNFDTVSFRFKPHDANFLPTLCRVLVRENDYLGTPLADVVVPVGTCQLNVPKYVQAQLGTLITNPSNLPLYAEFHSNGRCGMEIITSTGSRYSTSASITNLATLPNSSPTAGVCYWIENTGARNHYQTGVPTGAANAGSSTFGAWGFPVGIVPKFNRLQFIIWAYNASVLPTECRVRLRRVDRNGAIIATARVAVSFTAAAQQVVTVEFPEDVDPGVGQQCWLEVACDGYIGIGLSNASLFPFPTFPRNHYSVGASCETTPATETTLVQYFWIKTLLLDRAKPMVPTIGSLIRAIRQYGGGGSTTIPFVPACGVSLPSRIPAVEGFETNIYWDGLIRSWLPNSVYNIDIACTKGKQESNRWKYVPVNADVGTTPITVSVEFNNTTHAGLIPVSVTSNVITKAATFGAGATRKVLVIGDSTSATGRPTQQILDNEATNPNYAVTLLGTKGAGLNKHEGISGKTVAWFYTDPTSPFVFSGSFNFATYLTTNGYTMSSGDSVFILLGINDTFGAADDVSLSTIMGTMVTQLNAMITNMQAAVAGLKVWIGLPIPPAREQDAFGVNYASGQTRNRYAWNIASFRDQVVLNFDNRTGSNVYIAPIGLSLDTVNNMQTVPEAANARNATIVTRQSNGLHPDASGDYQIGDCLYCCLASVES